MKNLLYLLKALIYPIPFAVFTGLIILSIGAGAIFHQLHIPGIYLLEQEFQTSLKFNSHHYSYRPGESSDTIEYTTTQPNGQTKDLTLRVMTYSGLFYSLLIVILSFLTSITKHLFKKEALNTLPQTSLAVTSTICIIITGLSLITLLGTVIFMVSRAILSSW